MVLFSKMLLCIILKHLKVGQCQNIERFVEFNCINVKAYFSYLPIHIIRSLMSSIGTVHVLTSCIVNIGHFNLLTSGFTIS